MAETENETILAAQNQQVVSGNELVTAIADIAATNNATVTALTAITQQLNRLSNLVNLAELSNLQHLETIANCCGTGNQGIANSQLSQSDLNAKCLKANKMWYGFNWIVSSIREAELNDTLFWTAGIVGVGGAIAAAIADGPSPIGEVIGIGAAIAALASVALADWQKILNDLLANRSDIITRLYSATTDGEIINVWTTYLQDEAGVKELPFIWLLAKVTTIDIAFNPTKSIVTPSGWEPYTNCGGSTVIPVTVLETNTAPPLNVITIGGDNDTILGSAGEGFWLNATQSEFIIRCNSIDDINSVTADIYVSFTVDLVSAETYNPVYYFGSDKTLYEGVLYATSQTVQFSIVNALIEPGDYSTILNFVRPGDGHILNIHSIQVYYQNVIVSEG